VPGTFIAARKKVPGTNFQQAVELARRLNGTGPARLYFSDLPTAHPSDRECWRLGFLRRRSRAWALCVAQRSLLERDFAGVRGDFTSTSCAFELSRWRRHRPLVR
jgi:hypothetical protein